MENTDLSRFLKKEAVGKGLCKQWTEEWTDVETQQTLIEKYKRGFDFCLERDWPSSGFIKQMFDEKTLHDNFIYNDECVVVENGQNGVWIINGDCEGTLHFGNFAVATIHVRHNSRMKIMADSHALVFVRAHDSSRVEISVDSTARVKAIAYGNEAIVFAPDSVSIRRK